MIYTELGMAFFVQGGVGCFVAMMLQFMKFIALNTDSRSGIKEPVDLFFSNTGLNFYQLIDHGWTFYCI